MDLSPLRERLNLSYLRRLLSTSAGRAHVLAQMADAEASGEARVFDAALARVQDPELQRLIGKLREKGLGVLITDHSVRETLGICDRAVLLVEGKLLESGTPSQIAASERARAVYLGERFKLEE